MSNKYFKRFSNSVVVRKCPKKKKKKVIYSHETSIDFKDKAHFGGGVSPVSRVQQGPPGSSSIGTQPRSPPGPCQDPADICVFYSRSILNY